MTVNTRIINADCLDALGDIPSSSIDAVVTDPPYGLEFMEKDSSGIEENTNFLRAPGTSGSNNTYGPRFGVRQHGDEAGVKKVRLRSQAFGQWCETWTAECYRVLKPGGFLFAFGGTRTWHRLAVAVEESGFEMRDSIAWLYGSGFPKSHNLKGELAGWGTALKPSFEPIVMARKPLIGTVVANVAAHGTGAINIDATRILEQDHGQITLQKRWPANVVLDSQQAADIGDVSRYFYVAKPTRQEKPTHEGIKHPTVKPLALMRWLVRMVTPINGTVLDPFGGSGTTAEACILEGYNSIIIEQNAAYIPLIEHRIKRAHQAKN